MTLPPPEPPRLLAIEAMLRTPSLRFQRERILLPIGIEASFGIVRHPGSCLVVPILDDGHLILLRRYRYPVARRLLEFPSAGWETGNDPPDPTDPGHEARKDDPRLPLERTLGRALDQLGGYGASRWDRLGTLHPNPGYSDEVMQLFLVRAVPAKSATPAPPVDATEALDAEIVLMMPAQLEEAIAGGDEPLDGASVTAWFLARRLLAAAQLPPG